MSQSHHATHGIHEHDAILIFQLKTVGSFFHWFFTFFCQDIKNDIASAGSYFLWRQNYTLCQLQKKCAFPGSRFSSQKRDACTLNATTEAFITKIGENAVLRCRHHTRKKNLRRMQRNFLRKVPMTA